MSILTARSVEKIRRKILKEQALYEKQYREKNSAELLEGGSGTNAPIVLFVYNRPWHTRRTVEALRKNALARKSDLFIFSDAAKSEVDAESVAEVRAFIWQIDGFKTLSIVERDANLGLAKSIINGVTTVVNQFGCVIVIEDDLVTSPYFLQFMNDGLCIYEKEENVASIHGYVYPIVGLPETFFLMGADCWGWATWKDRWAMFEPDGEKLLNELKRRDVTRRFDFNGVYPFTLMLANQISGNNDSWAIRWHASAFIKGKFTLYPGRTLVQNIGLDGSGTHCGKTGAFPVDLETVPVRVEPIPVVETDSNFYKFEQYLKSVRPGFFVRTIIAMRDALRSV